MDINSGNEKLMSAPDVSKTEKVFAERKEMCKNLLNFVNWMQNNNKFSLENS